MSFRRPSGRLIFCLAALHPEHIFVARNCLCVNYLLNVRAANGEHGELGSGWCTGSCAPPGSQGDLCLWVFDELIVAVVY